MSQLFEWLIPKQIKELSQEQSVSCLQAITKELECLDLVIDAANKAKTQQFMVDSERRRTSFLELRRHAFGKTVVLDTKDGVKTYRVSQANCEFASTEIGYATPLSSIGQLCRAAYVGFDGENAIWGEFEVLEVRTFERFVGQESEDNIRNFRTMIKKNFINDSGTDENLFNIRNLRASVKKWFQSKVDSLSPSSVIEGVGADKNGTGSFLEQDKTGLLMDEFYLSNEPDIDIDIDDWEDEDELVDLPKREDEQDDFYGISNHFYLNPTPTQLQVMNSSFSSGPMLVEGIAGSGKTCVAIGRAKTLCDSASGGERLLNDQSEDFFAQESSIGFVRTGELVQYLKATCLELGLSHLPIQEYKELQHELRKDRDIEQRPVNHIDKEGNERFPKYQYMQSVDYDVQPETTMKWLSRVDHLIGALLSGRLSNLSDKLMLPNSLVFNEKMSEVSAQQILANLIENVEIELKSIKRELTSTNSTQRPYCIDSYTKKAYRILNELDKNWFNKDSLWIAPTKDQWIKVKDNTTAIVELKKHNALFLRIELRLPASILLTSMDDLKVVLSHVDDVFDKEGQKLNYNTDIELWDYLITKPCRCVLAGRYIALQMANEEDVLFCAAAGTLGITMDGKAVLPAVFKNPLFNYPVLRTTQGKAPSKVLLAKVFRNQIKGMLFNRLQYADLYLEALKSDNDEHFTQLNNPIIKRLESRSLADHDIDLLLAIAQIMSRGAIELKSVPYYLQEQSHYFRTVFIDEVQDFSEVQVFLMGRQAHPKYNSITMVGDLYQQLYSGSASNPALCFPYQGMIEKSLLIENKRQENKPNLMALSSIFRAELQEDERLFERLPEYKKILSTVQNDDMRLFDLPFTNVDEKVMQLIKDQPKGRTISVVCPTTEFATELEARLHPRLASEDFRESYVAEKVDLSKKYLIHFSAPENIKGLEFDTLIMAGFEHMDWSRIDDLNKVYVCISRPRKQLAVLADLTKVPRKFIDLFS